MAYVGYFLEACLLYYVLEGCRDVVGRMLPREVPILALVFVRIPLEMLPAVAVAPPVTQPYIVTLTRGQEGRTVFRVHYKRVSSVEESMPEEDRSLLLRGGLGEFARDAETTENVLILCDDFVLLKPPSI